MEYTSFAGGFMSATSFSLEPENHLGPGAPPRDARATRILKTLGKIFQHDLPNQLVVFQGLVQLLELEEQDALTPQAREYIERMKSVSQRAIHLGKYVKEMSHLANSREVPEVIAVPSLAKEMRAHARHTHGDINFDWQGEWADVQIYASRVAVLRCLAELIALTLVLAPCKAYRIALDSYTPDQTVRLHLALAPHGNPPPPFPTLPRVWESRLEFLFAAELLAGSGGTLQVRVTTTPGVIFDLDLPLAS